MSLFFAALLSVTASAQANDPLAEALEVIRGRVIFVSPSRNRQVREAGLIVMFTTLVATGGVWLATGLPISMGTALKRSVIGVPVAAFSAGAAMTAIGQYRFRREPAPRVAVHPVTQYQSTKGLNEFMGLTHTQQYEVAAANPKLAEFLIHVSDAYRFAVSHQLQDEDVTPSPTVESR